MHCQPAGFCRTKFVPIPGGGGSNTMQLVCSSIGAAAVATIYVIYGAYRDFLVRQLQYQRTLRERVAYMLWTMANQLQ
jgi:uncharacterized membrane protein